VLAAVAPDDRWRTWRWVLDDFNLSSALVLPNEDLPRLTAQLERIERAAAGQLTLGRRRQRRYKTRREAS
jgi:hypothetical protein